MAVFDPAGGNVPLPNVLATASAPDPITVYGTTPDGQAIPRPVGTPMTPPEALAYVNLREMGNTNAVSGINAPIYIHFSSAVNGATPANIKVFQLTPDALGTEEAPLGFKDISGMFTYQYKGGDTNLFLFPNFPMMPGTRYLYVVTNRVTDAASGNPVYGSDTFELMKSVSPIAAPGSKLGALEAIRDNVLLDATKPHSSSTNPVKFSGYAKVMDDLIAASATTTVTSRADIALMGRFITTGAGLISETKTSPSASDPTTIPFETALRLFALGKNPIPPYPVNTPQGLPGKTWSHTITVPANTATSISTFSVGTPPATPDMYWAGVLKAAGKPITAAPTTVGMVVLGTINSAELSLDPAVSTATANVATMDQTAVANAYNPAAGVIQAFRVSNNLVGFYHTTRSIPFVYIAPVGTAPTGGWPLVIFQHGITRQKEDVLALAQTLTTVGRAVIAIDLPLHGQLAVPAHTTGDLWGQDFMAIGAPLATRSNVQQAAFNLNRLEFTVRFGGFAGLTTSMPSMTNISFVGQSLGSIVGAYYLAGNTTLDPTTGHLPYTQTTLNTDMKGYLSVPGGRLAYVIQNSPAFNGPNPDPTKAYVIDKSLLALAKIETGSPTYHNFFQVTQSVVDPIDPATMTTPLYGKPLAPVDGPSRLSGRLVIQESTSSTFQTVIGQDSFTYPADGDLVITNPYTRYFGNALGGRGVLGAAGLAVAPGFSQLAYTAGGTPAHAPGVPVQFMHTIKNGAVANNVADAAVIGSAQAPSEGYFQFDQANIGHGALLDPTASLANTMLMQKQMRYFLGFTGFSIVVDPTQGAPALPLIVSPAQDVQVPELFTILGH
jgi:hypothetical protein